MKNIFTYEGTRGELVETFYNLLMTRKLISYEDILIEYDGGTLSTPKVTGHDLYKTLKHIVPELVETLTTHGYSVLSIPNGRTTSYQYVGSDSNPLKNIRFKAILAERYAILNQCIKGKQPVTIVYKPFDRSKMEIIFHPHLLYSYNGRDFAFGVSEKKGKYPFRKFCIALDRIEGEIISANSAIQYIPALKDEYSYLSQLVGVRLEDGAELQTIRIRAVDRYTFGRITTKPLHNLQKTIIYPSWKEGREYGEIEIEVYPNVELVGQILSYGNMLEVISPQDFRERVQQEIQAMMSQYTNTRPNSSQTEEPIL